MSEQISTVTLNAAIDKTYYLKEVSKGTVMRAEKVLAAAGGKGINVARVLRQLGHEKVAATGFAGGYNGRFIVDHVKEMGIADEFIAVSGESRLCLNFIDRTDSSTTEVLEPGPEIRYDQLEMLKQRIQDLSGRSKLIIFSGSIPHGLQSGLYAELIELAAASGAEVFLDASGEPLARGLKAKPSFIKPNEDEVRPWLPDGADSDVGAAVTALMAKGIPNVVITLGAEGAVAGIAGRVYRVQIPALQAVNTVGCGDAFVAGFAFAHVRDWSAQECLRYAAAAGCANALSPIAGDVRLSDHRRLLGEIRISEWQL
jgi:tagatose 6-phosphate kinase